MADHDRDAGSRGEEEAPRDPTPSSEPSQPEQNQTEPSRPEPTRELHEPGPLKYGEQADRASTYLPPTQPNPASWEREQAPFGDFLRRRRTQVMGAGLVGLVVGGLLGGVTVAAFSDLAHDHDHGMRMEAPGWGHHREWGPRLKGPECYESGDGAYCVLEPRGRLAPDEPPEYVFPDPTYTG
ncbi:hypothetical protein [Nonomuraea rubra]|uniref:hypothetical protein n=1 Tax=Nonomuraea rubra TaxID=46180 RepID=UPI0033EA9B88